LIVRESWNEDFRTKGNPAKGIPPQEAVRVYVRGMMLVRGVYVGESVGDMDYYPSNGQQNYGDAFEGAKTAAFRRCAKEFGVGVQAWDKHWCDGWWQRKRTTPLPPPAPRPATVQPPAKPVVERIADVASRALTQEERKAILLAKLRGFEPEANKVFLEEGLIFEGEHFMDISVTRVELMTPDQMLALIKTVKQRKADNDQIPGAEVSSEDLEKAHQSELEADPVGTVEETNQKDGKTKAGKPWVKYGVKIDGGWLNTFSATDYETATALKGRQVRYTFAETKFGKDLLTIESAEENQP
jgi:hypothetical protein